jgi:hypothetical protein
MSTLLLLAALAFQSGDTIRIAGTVADATGRPLHGATVELDGRLVATSDERGVFAIVVAGPGTPTLRISLDGFESHEEVLKPGATALNVELEVRRLEDFVRVTAPPVRARVDPVFVRQPIDVYRTPGAQADLFRALQTLPGVVAPDDAAGLFVRGGDVGEVLVTLDDALLAHPYRYETPTGGFRGAVDPLLISGLAFSTGGFSARYGNALSAVVELRGLDRPELPELSGTFGLAGVAASVATPLRDGLGLRAAANRTFTGLLFAVNDVSRVFDPAPEGWDASASVGWDLNDAGQLKALALVQRDTVGVEAEQDAFAGLLRASSRHDFTLIRWDGSLDQWTAAATLGVDRYSRRTVVGISDLDVEDRTQSWRLEAIRSGHHVDWRVGSSGAFTGTAIAGRVPIAGGDLAGISGESAFDVKVDDSYGGAYLEATTSLGIVETTAGARVDRFANARATTLDPRLNLRIALGRTRSIRYATGIYHQAPSATYYDRVRGTSSLAPMRAAHHVVGYEAGSEAEGVYFRAEGYLKRYGDLPLELERLGYSSDGYGRSQGLDLFAQWRTSRLDVRATGSYLRARRRWTSPEQRNRYPLPEGTWRPDFEIPWSANLVATVPLGREVAVAGSWRTAAGRLHTPIVGGVPTPAGVAPVFGAVNSERLPRYERLDIAVSWLVPAGAGVMVLFASVDNALDRSNFFHYRYAPDYSSRRPVELTSQRSMYVGATYRR